jgi:hypothetical protein
MGMDSDELYVKEEFDHMKQIVVDGNHDASACQMLTYYKTGEYIIDPPEDYYVPLFYKIESHRGFELGASFPVLVDPTRGIPSTNVRLFKRNEIQMHHYSYVRRDIRRKLVNSSAYGNYSASVSKIVEDYENFNGQFANSAGRIYNVRKLEKPYFDISI